METEVVPCSYYGNDNKPLSNTPQSLLKRLSERKMDAEEWVESHGSGTLRKNKKIGFAWRTHYLEERIAYEFGYAFEMKPKTRVTFGDAISEGDCKPLTEAGWFIERYMALSIFPEDYFECKYLFVNEGEKTREGVGVIVRATSFKIPPGNLILAIVAEYDKFTGQFMPARII